MNSVNKCPICDEIFDLSDYERYENHLLSKHADVMAIVEKLDECWYDIELEERKEILLGLVEIGFGSDELPEYWKRKDAIVKGNKVCPDCRDTIADIYQLNGWETVVYVGKALRIEQLEIKKLKMRCKNENNKN